MQTRPRFRLPTVSAYGLYLGVILLLLAIPAALIYAAAWGYFSHSYGLQVHTGIPNMEMPSERRVIVTVSSGVRRGDSKVFLNGAFVSPSELRSALRRELSRRNQRIVYVEGDEDLAFQHVVSVIDIAQQAWPGVSIVMLTPKLKQQIEQAER